MIPLNNEMKISAIFYDSEFTHKYMDETITKNIVLYVKIKRNEESYTNISKDEALLMICEDYYDQYVNDATITREDIYIQTYYGNYNESYIVTVTDKESGLGWFLITDVTIGGINLTFPTTTLPKVWEKGTFYTLEEAYEKNILTVENLQAFANDLNKNNEN